MSTHGPNPVGGAANPPEPQGERRLAVIMFTDMVGYSALSQRDEALALELLEEHRRIVRPLLRRHGGREIKTIGDAFLVEFTSALAGTLCAIEIQRALHGRNLAAPAEREIRIRLGLHAGDVVVRENDILGDGVNIAARLEPLAEPGGICLSEDVARQISNKTPYALARLGPAELKHISLPMELYRIVLPWLGAPPASSHLGLRRRRGTLRPLLIGAAVVVAGLAAFRWWPRPAAAAPANRLAVLPLVNLSSESRDESFADGMTEELISSLSMISRLEVIARTSVAKFKGARLDVGEIGRALQVGSILEGAVRIAGDQVRINVSLVQVGSHKTLWSGEYTRMLKDIFAVQSAIAASVTEALKVRLLAGEIDRMERRGTGSSEASRQYLLGRAQLNRRTGDGIMSAIDCFTRAVAEDATFALAHAALAESYTLAGGAGYGQLPRDKAIAHARAHAARAVELDPGLAEAHAALGYVRFRLDWDWPGAEAEFRRALDLKPGDARAREVYALYLAIRRRFPEANAEMTRAHQLDPLSSSVSNGLGRILHFQHRFDEAVRQFQRTLEADPQYAEAYFSLGLTHIATKRYDDAIANIQRAIALSGRRPVMIASLADAYGFSGRTAEARQVFDELLAQSPQTEHSSYYLGIASVGIGDYDRAFEYFEQAFRERNGILIYLAVDPISEVLWKDPRFSDLVRRMGLAP